MGETKESFSLVLGNFLCITNHIDDAETCCYVPFRYCMVGEGPSSWTCMYIYSYIFLPLEFSVSMYTYNDLTSWHSMVGKNIHSFDQNDKIYIAARRLADINIYLLCTSTPTV